MRLPAPPGYHWSERPSQDWAEPIAELLNQVIASGPAYYRQSPMSLRECQDWLARKTLQGEPLLVLQQGGRLAAFASYQPFRAQECTQGVLEHSLYVQPAHQRRGLAGALLTQLQVCALSQGAWQFIAAIDSGNLGSLALHRRHGFQPVGHIPRMAFKQQQWLSLELWAKDITAATPSP